MTLRLKALALLAPLGLAMGATPACAAGAGDDRFLHFGGETEAPRGYVELCQTMAAVCHGFAAGEAASADLATPVSPPAPGGPYCPDFSCLPPAPAPSAMVLNVSVMLSIMPSAARSAAAWPFPARSAAANVPHLTPRLTIAALRPAASAPALFDLMPLFRTAPAPAFPRHPTQPADERQLTRQIIQVNARVNHTVRQVMDIRTYGRDDVWRPSGTGPGAAGDCEDLALEKRLELITAGFPAERLFMAIVFRPDVGLHAVLVARLPSGDRVLDSRVDYIQRWSRSGYAWLNLEQPGVPEHWFYAA